MSSARPCPASRSADTLSDGADQVVDVGVDVLRPVLGVEAAAQFQVGLAVDGEYGRRAEGVVHRRVVQLGAEPFRMGPDELHVVVPADEPQPDRRDVADRGRSPQPRVNRVGVLLKRVHGDRLGEGGDGVAAHGRIVRTQTITVKARGGPAGTAVGPGSTRRYVSRPAGATRRPAARAPVCKRRSHTATINSASPTASALARCTAPAPLSAWRGARWPALRSTARVSSTGRVADQ